MSAHTSAIKVDGAAGVTEVEIKVSSVDGVEINVSSVDCLASEPHAEIKRVDPARARRILEGEKLGLLFKVMLLEGYLDFSI